MLAQWAAMTEDFVPFLCSALQMYSQLVRIESHVIEWIHIHEVVLVDIWQAGELILLVCSPHESPQLKLAIQNETQKNNE